MSDSAGHAAAHDHDLDEEEEEELDQISSPLREVLRERLISLRTMRPELKISVILGIALILVVAALLGAKDLHDGVFKPSIYAFPSEEGDGFQLISSMAFWTAIAVTSLAWAYVLSAAMRSNWVVRVLIVGTFGWAFYDEKDALSTLSTMTKAICITLVGIVVVMAIATWFPERKKLGPGETPGGLWGKLRPLTVPLLFLVVGGIYLAVYMASHAIDVHGAAASVDQSQTSVFSNDVFDQIDNIQYLLIPLLVLAGSDFGEWGHLVVARVSHRIRKMSSPMLFGVVAFVAAGATAWNGWRISGGPDGGGEGSLYEVILGLVVGVIVLGLGWLAKPKGGWSTGVPFVAIAAVAILDTVSGFIVSALEQNSPHLDQYLTLVSAGLWMLGAVVALGALIVRRGRLSPAVTAGAIFIVLVGVSDLFNSVWNLWALHTTNQNVLGISPTHAPFMGPEGLMAAAGIIAVVVVLAAVVMRRIREWTVPIALTLTTAVAVEVLFYIDSLYGHHKSLESVTAAGGVAIGASILLVGALLWDLVVSGEAVTNGHGDWFRRDTRVFGFVGYMLMLASAVLLFSSLHDQSGKLAESTFDPEEWVRQGILFLGVPIVLTVAICGFHRWRAEGASEGESAEA